MNRFRNDEDPADAEVHEPSGRVQFDDRGNAVWQAARRRRIDNPTLKIADDEPIAQRRVHHNTVGLKNGYDPYASGVLKDNKKKEEPRKKKDLRALSKWIQLKKNMDGTPKD